MKTKLPMIVSIYESYRWFLCLLFFYPLSISAQVNFTANDQVPRYEGTFGYGVNPGSYPHAGGRYWRDEELAEIAARLELNSERLALYEFFLEQWGYGIRSREFDIYETLGLSDHTVFIGYPSDQHLDPTSFCDEGPSRLFANLYEPIWDGGANGTAYNDENYYARYVYKMVDTYKDHVRFWEVWNEPDFTYTSHAFDFPGTPGSWWDVDPDPCDLPQLRAPVYHYIRMLRITYEIVKTLDPDAYVAVGGIGFESFLDVLLRNTDNPDGGKVSNDFPLKGGAYFDVLSYHYYPHVANAFRYWDNRIQNWAYTRHSDAGVEGLTQRKTAFQNVLYTHGYNGQLFPEKEWIITETNMPRKRIDNGFGSPEAQRNFAIKSLIACQQNGICQLHFYKMGEEIDEEDATQEWQLFRLMGLYKNLIGKSLNTVQPTDEGIAIHTTALLLKEYLYAPMQTNNLQLPDDIGGAAFRHPDGGLMYVLWGKTKTDLSESATVRYTFPDRLDWKRPGAKLEQYRWDHSKTNRSSEVSSDNIQLDGSPLFFRVIESPLNGCEDFAASAQVEDVLCFGEDDGHIELAVSGGSPPYSYQWSSGNGQNLPAGSYTVTITDAEGCSTQLQTNIQQPDPLTCDYLVTQQGCGATNEYNACPTVSGGVPPYTYLWKNNNTSQCLQSDDLQDFLLTITDANGCTIVQAPTDVVTTDALKITIVGKTNVQCFDGTDGWIDLQVEGGTLPYTFQWNNGEETQDLQGLPAGTYFLTVTDAEGCSGQWQTDIQQPEPLICDYLVTQQGCSATNEYNACPTVSGGVPPYTYLWKNNNITQCLQSDDLQDFLLTITDANGCSIVQAPTDVVTTDALKITIVGKTNVQCFDGTDGQIDLQVEGGTLPYTFQWSNGEETQDLQGLPAGTYFLTVTDAKGCSGQWQTDIQQPEPLTCDYLVTQQGCGATNEYNACPTISGGVPPYTYLWKNNNITQCLQSDDLEDFLLTITDANGCSIVQAPTDVVTTDALQITIVRKTNVQCFDGTDGQINLQVEGGTLPYTFQWSNGEETQDLQGLPAGTYFLTVTDAEGCSGQWQTDIQQPEPLTCDYLVTQQGCGATNDYNACPTVSGGVPPYTYLWKNNNITQCLQSDDLQDFLLTITDANGCSIVQAPTDVVATDALQIAIVRATNVQCFDGTDGQIDLQVEGGTLPYTFQWSNGEETQDLRGLAAGTYSVTVTDGGGCSAQTSRTLEQPTRLTCDYKVLQSSCNGLIEYSACPEVSGGVQPYRYEWLDGSNEQCLKSSSLQEFVLSITDANDCNIVKPPSGLIEKLNLIVLGNTTDVQCFGGSDGSIDLQGIGGTPPYAFRWAGGQETTSLKDLSVGDYLVTLTDAEGCSAVGSFSVEQPDRLSIEEQVTQASSGSLGAIQTQVNGGVPPYQYLWSNNENSQNVEGLEAGTYQLTVTDANGCTHTKAFEISFTVSSQEVSKVEAYLQIFPNPGKGLFNIRTDETFSATQWQVYNASGSLIQEEAFIPSGQQLNLSHLPSGLYLVRLQNQAGQMRSSQLVILP